MVYKKNCCWYNLELRKYLIWYHTENRTSRETTGCPEKKKKNKTKNLKHFIRWGLRSILESVLPRIFNNDLDTKWKLLMKYKYNTKLRSTGTAKEGKKSYKPRKNKVTFEEQLHCTFILCLKPLPQELQDKILISLTAHQQKTPERITMTLYSTWRHNCTIFPVETKL